LSQVISANLTRAALEAAPVIADLSTWLADVAGKAGIAWERLFDAPEEKSLRTLRYELDLASSTIEKLEGRIQELRESPTLGFTTFLDTAQISAIERKLDELRRARDQTQARIAFLEGPPATAAPASRLDRTASCAHFLWVFIRVVPALHLHDRGPGKPSTAGGGVARTREQRTRWGERSRRKILYAAEAGDP
jgi:hypothetical protein